MNKGNKISKLGDIGKVVMCKRVLKSQTSDFGEIPFYKISTFGSEPVNFISKTLYDEYRMKYNHPKKGDILISAAGTIGKTVIYDGKPAYFQDSNIVWIKNNEEKVLNSFLYYYYQTQPWIATNGSTIKRLYNDNIRNLIINYPEIPVQKQIAKVLGDLDYKIEINSKINNELEAIAKTIYNYWFVQFDFPDANGKPYKASGGKIVYNVTLKKDIPEGWQYKTIADWIEKDKSGDWGKEFKQGNYTEQVSCIRGADINGLNGNGVVKAPERFILEKNTHKLLEEGDLIIEISGGSPTQSTGRMAFITQETLERFENPLICSNFCKAVTLKDETYLYNFVYQWQRLYDAGVLFGWEGKTSGIKNLLFESFVTNYKTVFPKKDIVEKFYQKIKPIHAKKQKNLRENQKLADLRDWLLPMLMNGQVTVKEAQEHINQAAEPQEVYQKNA
ncbi:restriction endonuclease subunit S [Cellulophaga sp. HaHaR_3_176]|uniref:restriction endonuclease subunit S n=1 Tax=Cellulophaga sp. HaHaR_3_176 TaxID=1942464 RepID=UPI001C1F5E6A|nr:restriction endonuclease subunit S [Cellulophaga sp. HaHaR_3_176]QWX83570.1 restriction endonuclease subunit S [Cellulophaga sp. HaHaR_3_176]